MASNIYDIATKNCRSGSKIALINDLIVSQTYDCSEILAHHSILIEAYSAIALMLWLYVMFQLFNILPFSRSDGTARINVRCAIASWKRWLW